MASYGDELAQFAKRRKTAVPCKRFMMGACTLGDACMDLHYKPICKRFAMGACAQGSDCPDSHGEKVPFDFASAAAYNSSEAAGASPDIASAATNPALNFSAAALAAAFGTSSDAAASLDLSAATAPAFDLSSAAAELAAWTGGSAATDLAAWASGSAATDLAAWASGSAATDLAAWGGDSSSAAWGGDSPTAAWGADSSTAAWGADSSTSSIAAASSFAKLKPVGRQDGGPARPGPVAKPAWQDDSSWGADSLWAAATALAAGPSWGGKGAAAPKGGKFGSQKGKKGGFEGGKKGGGKEGKKGEGKKGKAPPTQKDGDWLCNSCNNVNFQWRTECNFCGAPKPEEVIKAEKEKAAKAAAGANGKNRAARDWACPKCNKPNFAWRTECFACNEERPPMPEVDPTQPNDKAVGFKVALCRFNLVNKCERGSACTYAHGLPELAGSKGTVKTSLCKYFAVGQCGRGALCTFAHGNEDLVHRHGKEQDRAKEAWQNAHLTLAVSGLKDLPAETTAHLQTHLQAPTPSLSALQLPPMPELPPMDPEKILQGMELQQSAAASSLAPNPFGPFASFDFSAFSEGY